MRFSFVEKMRIGLESEKDGIEEKKPDGSSKKSSDLVMADQIIIDTHGLVRSDAADDERRKKDKNLRLAMLKFEEGVVLPTPSSK